MKQFYKNLLPVAGLIAGIFFQTAPLKAQNLEDPGSYITAISNTQTDMNKMYLAYMSASAHGGKERKVEKMREQVLESITNCKYKLIDLPYYKGDNSLRQSSMDYVQMCYKMFSEDYSHIVNMEEIAEQSFDEMQAYLLLQEKTEEKMTQVAQRMDTAYKGFAAKYNVKLVDGKSELSNKMETAGKLNHYRNQLYMLFFKCNWQNSQITEAMNKKNLNNIEQSRNALINYANEGLAALDTLKSFAGDASLATACRMALNYYKKAAEKDLPTLTDFYLKQDNFDKVKKDFDGKSQSERTKQDVDAYNKAVNDINAAAGKFNSVNQSLNTSHNQMLQNWDNAQLAFADAHMPYYSK